jgi:hypothetical protein
MLNRKTITTAVFLIAATVAVSVPVQAGDSGAFIGGMLASRVMGNMQQQTEAEQQQAAAAQQQAYQQQQPVQRAAPAQTTEQKLAELDKLAAGGYISAAEYKAKKQSIIDRM